MSPISFRWYGPHGRFLRCFGRLRLEQRLLPRSRLKPGAGNMSCIKCAPGLSLLPMACRSYSDSPEVVVDISPRVEDFVSTIEDRVALFRFVVRPPPMKHLIVADLIVHC